MLHRVFIASILAAALLPAQARQPVMEEVGKTNLPSQKLGIDDLIAISVYDAPELTRTVRVEPDGTIRLPLVKRSIPAKGLLPGPLEASIADALRNEQLLVEPIVKVTVVEYHSRPIAVMGAVHKPLTFQSVGSVTLLDALARAEGLTNEAGMDIVLTREGENQRISVKRLLKDADPAANVVLHGGEEIRVPEAGKIFVVGNVKKPGAFPVRDAADSSVLKAVAISEGLTAYASKQAFLYRRDANGVKQEIPIELEKILARRAPDLALEADDLLYIPDNKGRRNAMTAIDRITSFGASTASGILIWRH